MVHKVQGQACRPHTGAGVTHIAARRVSQDPQPVRRIDPTAATAPDRSRYCRLGAKAPQSMPARDPVRLLLASRTAVTPFATSQRTVTVLGKSRKSTCPSMQQATPNQPQWTGISEGAGLCTLQPRETFQCGAAVWVYNCSRAAACACWQSWPHVLFAAADPLELQLSSSRTSRPQAGRPTAVAVAAISRTADQLACKAYQPPRDCYRPPADSRRSA